MNTQLKNKCKNYNFQELFKKKGYSYFTNGDYNLNIIGIRAKGKEITNKFDDILCVIFKQNGIWKRYLYNITTDPGLYYMTQGCNLNGCAILVPGQYRGLWKIGLHKGQYEALVQNKPVKVYRDKNKDNIYDFNSKTIDEGVFGINLHKAGKESIQIDNWSAGCQVFASAQKFNEFMTFANKQVKSGMGETFTYTLLKEEDLI